MDFGLDNMDERYKKIYEIFQKKETISAVDLERKIEHVISAKDSIHTINKHIKKDGLVLSKTRDETTGKSYLLLRHIVQTHDDCWKSLEVPGGATSWSTAEKTNLQEIATRILSDEMKQVWVDSKDEEIRNSYERLLEHKWLNFEKKNSTLTLGPRFLGQMKPWIEWKTQKQYHCDACTLCVVRGYFCDDCNDHAHHLMCLKKSKTDPKCQTCQSTMKNNLSLMKRHIKTEHEGNPPLKLNCDRCKYTSASDKTHLKNHIKTVHEGIRTHLCDKCDYKAAEKRSLKRHIDQQSKSNQSNLQRSAESPESSPIMRTTGRARARVLASQSVHQEKSTSSESEQSLLSSRKSKKSKSQGGGRQFIDSEANLSGDEASQDEADETDQNYDESFVDDASQAVDHAVYLQSVRTPEFRKLARPLPPITADIFSQAVRDSEEDDYEEDSFCVGDSMVELDSCQDTLDLLEAEAEDADREGRRRTKVAAKRKIILLNSSSEESVDNSLTHRDKKRKRITRIPADDDTLPQSSPPRQEPGESSQSSLTTEDPPAEEYNQKGLK